MRIVQHAPTQLIAHNSPFGIRLGSSLLLILGALMFAIPMPSVNEGLSGQACGCIIIVLGIFLLLTSGRFITWTFDKSDDSLLIQSQVLFITKVLKYPLTEVSNVQIESKMMEDDYIFGIELLLKGGKRLHLCPSFNLSEFTAKEGVRRISSFLDL
jgi:membrane protein YdbS with pleckstrin-like domain